MIGYLGRHLIIIMLFLFFSVPEITVQPKSLKNVPQGKRASFSVSARGKDLTYSWYHNDVPLYSNGRVQIIQQKDASSLQIENIQPSDDEGCYVCKISNPTDGSVKTESAQLTTGMH